MPILSTPLLAQELVDLNHWWDEDNVAQHILISRLGVIPRGLLPSADCMELMNTLYNTPCTTGRVHKYVSKWRIGMSCLQSAKFPFSIKISISQFVRGLPLIATFTSLRADVSYCIVMADDQDFGVFIGLTETVL